MTERHQALARRGLIVAAVALALTGCGGLATAPTATPSLAPTVPVPVANTATATSSPPTATALPEATATRVSPTSAPSATVAPAATPTPVIAATRPAFRPDAAFQHVEALAVGIGVRAAGTEGEARAAAYLDEQLTKLGYRVTRQEFPIVAFRDEGASLRVDGLDGGLRPTTLRLSAGGQVTAPLVVVPGAGTAADLARVDVRNRIAVVDRGSLTFQDKVANARAAGAAAVVIVNNAEGSFSGTLSAPSEVPAASLTRTDGERLKAAIAERGTVTATLDIKARVERTPSQNVIASRADLPPNLPVIVIGGHYDSVPAGPGANDNASGTAVALELARALAGERQAEIRFVGFGAEEIGLVGSRHYVDSLSPAERKRIVGMVNLDMLAVGQALQIGGSDDLATRAIAIARDLGVTNVSRLGNGSDRFGASDHASFMAAGIPSLFINRPDDPRYHTAQDQASHVSVDALRIAGLVSLGVIDYVLGR